MRCFGVSGVEWSTILFIPSFWYQKHQGLECMIYKQSFWYEIMAVFFNLFSEPFEAILVAHGTRVFFGGRLLRPEGPKFEAESEGGLLGRGQ